MTNTVARAETLVITTLAIALAVVAAGCGSSGSKSSSTPVAVRVTAPEDGSAVHGSRVAVRGTVNPPDASVQVTGQPAQVNGGVFSASVPLRPGDNRIAVVATSTGSAPANTAITVTRPRRHRATAPATTTSASTSSAPASSRSCGEGVTVNATTSCPFAIAVRHEYSIDGSPQIDVSSPVTKQTYSMTCTPSGAHVTCRGGNNAVVTF